MTERVLKNIFQGKDNPQILLIELIDGKSQLLVVFKNILTGHMTNFANELHVLKKEALKEGETEIPPIDVHEFDYYMKQVLVKIKVLGCISITNMFESYLSELFKNQVEYNILNMNQLDKCSEEDLKRFNTKYENLEAALTDVKWTTYESKKTFKTDIVETNFDEYIAVVLKGIYQRCKEVCDTILKGLKGYEKGSTMLIRDIQITDLLVPKERQLYYRVVFGFRYSFEEQFKGTE